MVDSTCLLNFVWSTEIVVGEEFDIPLVVSQDNKGSLRRNTEQVCGILNGSVHNGLDLG
jgi:hypothetical protein